MTNFTKTRINLEITSLQTVYDYLKSKMAFDPSDFELATVIFSTITALKDSLEYEESLKDKTNSYNADALSFQILETA